MNERFVCGGEARLQQCQQQLPPALAILTAHVSKRVLGRPCSTGLFWELSLPILQQTYLCAQDFKPSEASRGQDLSKGAAVIRCDTSWGEGPGRSHVFQEEVTFVGWGVGCHPLSQKKRRRFHWNWMGCIAEGYSDPISESAGLRLTWTEFIEDLMDLLSVFCFAFVWDPLLVLGFLFGQLSSWALRWIFCLINS